MGPGTHFGTRGTNLGAALFARHNSFFHQSLRRLVAPKASALPGCATPDRKSLKDFTPLVKRARLAGAKPRLSQNSQIALTLEILRQSATPPLSNGAGKGRAPAGKAGSLVSDLAEHALVQSRRRTVHESTAFAHCQPTRPARGLAFNQPGPSVVHRVRVGRAIVWVGLLTLPPSSLPRCQALHPEDERRPG
jgi:hypothetical protein